RRSTFVTTSWSPALKKSKTVASSVRPVVLVPLVFSCRTTVQPAFVRASTWSEVSWSMVLTRAYPILVIIPPEVSYLGLDREWILSQILKVNPNKTRPVSHDDGSWRYTYPIQLVLGLEGRSTQASKSHAGRGLSEHSYPGTL